MDWGGHAFDKGDPPDESWPRRTAIDSHTHHSNDVVFRDKVDPDGLCGANQAFHFPPPYDKTARETIPTLAYLTHIVHAGLRLVIGRKNPFGIGILAFSA
jgi:hypothetical protein